MEKSSQQKTYREREGERERDRIREVAEQKPYFNFIFRDR